MNAVPPLSANTLIPLRAPSAVLAQLREHLGEHGTVSGGGQAWSLSLEIGKANASLSDGGVAFRVEAEDETSLSFLQWIIADHVCEFAAGETPRIVWEGGTRAGAPLPYFREMTVLRARQVTPCMRRLTLAGKDLDRFARGGLHIRLLLPPRPGVVPVWPVMGADGRQAWPEGERPAMRIYTIRRIDVEAGEIDVDFVLHEGAEMPGARFAVEAQPGAVVGMTGPGGGTLVPCTHYIFAGDETALPAIARMLEELPSEARAKAIIEIADEAEKQELVKRPGTEVIWLSRNGRAPGTTSLLADALRGLDPAEWQKEPYVWAGCEHAAARALRNFLKHERDVPKKRQLVAAYWRRGEAGEIRL